MMKRHILLFVVLIGSINFSIAQWQHTYGPYGGIVVDDFAINGSTILAAASSRIFISSDNGSNWSETNFDYYYLRSVEIIGTHFFASTNDAGIYTSTDNGASWHTVNNGLTDLFLLSTAVIGNTIFAGSQSGLFASTDYGANWIEINIGFPHPSIQALTVNGTSIYASTENGLYMSPNSGGNWTGLGYPYTASTIAVSGNYIYLGSWGQGVSVSNNGGLTFLPVSSGLPDIYIGSIIIIGTDVYAGTNEKGVFKSTLGGNSWTEINNGLPELHILSLANIGNKVLTGTLGAGIYSTTNYGVNWIPQNTGLIKTGVYSLATHENKVFAGTQSNGVSISTNDGLTWTEINNGLPHDKINSLAYIGNNLFAGTYGVFVSTDNGTSWSPTSIAQKYINAITGVGGNVFVGTDYAGFYLSTNNGASFTSVNSGLAGLEVNAVTTSGTNIFASTWWGGAFRMNYNWQGWTQVNNGLTSMHIRAFAFNGTDLYAGTPEGIFSSTDLGNNWSHCLENYNISSLVMYDTLLFAGTMNGGVLRSSNKGASWEPINDALTDLYINSLAFDNNYLYAGGTSSGVWRRPLTEIQAIQELNEESNISVYPNPSSNSITIKNSAPTKNDILSIYNPQGQLLFQQNLIKPSTSIDISHLSPGVYFLRLIKINGIRLSRFIKK